MNSHRMPAWALKGILQGTLAVPPAFDRRDRTRIPAARRGDHLERSGARVAIADVPNF